MTAPVPVLTDARGRLTIGPARTSDDFTLFAAGATSFAFDHDGDRKYVYVDDSTPNRDAVATRLVSMVGNANVIVSLKPDEPKHRIPGCVMLLEWFAGWPLPPKTDGYILWWDFVAPGEHQVSLVKRAMMLLHLAHDSPQFLWTY